MRYSALTVEASSGNFRVLSSFLEKLGIKAHRAHTLDDIQTALATAKQFSVAIIDVMGYGDRVWDFCRLLREKDVPMLIISPEGKSEFIRSVNRSGVTGIFKKPVVMRELADCIRALLSNEAQEQGM